MAGTRAGALKTKQTILEDRPEHYSVIGSIGGKKKVPKGFAITGKGAEAGRIGGSKSSRKITTKLEDDLIIRLHKAGLRGTQIAKETGINYPVVSSRVRVWKTKNK